MRVREMPDGIHPMCEVPGLTEEHGMAKCEGHTGRNERDSGIEAIKVIAIILIVINHVCATVGGESEMAGSVREYALNLKLATDSAQVFAIICFRYFGVLGNYIFMVCSAYFLVDSKEVNKNKILVMMMNVWVLSMAALIVCLLAGMKVPEKLIIKSLLPNIFANNWYITCYLMLYVAHPVLNLIIRSMSQKKLLCFCLAAFALYFGLNFIKPDLFFTSNIIIFITIYFVVAYLKIYLGGLWNGKTSRFMCLAGILCHYVLVMITNAMGLRFPAFSDQLLYWKGGGNPFLLTAAVGLVGIGLNWRIQNRAVNYLSGLSMLIYIIHENILVRNLIRPEGYRNIYRMTGQKNQLGGVMLYSVIIFIVSALLGAIYKFTIGRGISVCGEKLADSAEQKTNVLLDRIMERTAGRGRQQDSIS